MPVDRPTFDADLAAERTAVGNYIAAVTAFITSQPVLDLAAEDATVQSDLTDIATAQGQIPGQPPPGPAKPAA